MSAHEARGRKSAENACKGRGTGGFRGRGHESGRGIGRGHYKLLYTNQFSLQNLITNLTAGQVNIEELDLLCDNQSACEFLRDGKSHERQDFNKVRQDYCKEKTAFKRVSENHKLRKDTASADFVARFGDDHYKFLMKLNRFLDDISRFQQNLMNDSKFNDVDLEVLAPVAGHIFSICSLDDYEIDPNGQLMLESFLQIGSKNKILSVCKAVNALLKVANERNGQLEYRMPIVQMCTKQIKYIWLAINEAREDMSRQAAARDEDECMQKEFDRLMHALTLNKIIYGPYDEDDDWGSGSKIFPAFVGFLKSNDPKDGKEQELLNELNSFNDYLKENGPFIGGKQVCAADLLLGPKLYHMDIALGHYKNWSVPEVLTYVKSYMKDIFSRDSFVKTLASRLDVIAGWAKHMG